MGLQKFCFEKTRGQVLKLCQPSQSSARKEVHRSSREHQQSQMPHLATPKSCQPGWGSPWVPSESLPGKRRLTGEPSPALEAEGKQKYGEKRNPRVPDWKEAKQSSQEVACPSARASGKGLWEPPLKRGYGQGKGRVFRAGQIWVPEFHFHCTTY